MAGANSGKPKPAMVRMKAPTAAALAPSTLPYESVTYACAEAKEVDAHDELAWEAGREQELGADLVEGGRHHGRGKGR